MDRCGISRWSPDSKQGEGIGCPRVAEGYPPGADEAAARGYLEVSATPVLGPWHSSGSTTTSLYKCLSPQRDGGLSPHGTPQITPTGTDIDTACPLWQESSPSAGRAPLREKRQKWACSVHPNPQEAGGECPSGRALTSTSPLRPRLPQGRLHGKGLEARGGTQGREGFQQDSPCPSPGPREPSAPIAGCVRLDTWKDARPPCSDGAHLTGHPGRPANSPALHSETVAQLETCGSQN